VLAVHVFGLSQAFMAPWAALLTVQGTVFGTLRRGAQQAGAGVLGVLIAFGGERVFGTDEFAEGCRCDRADDWLAYADRLDADVDRAWRVLEEAQESGRLNPRRAVCAPPRR
jgi:hypothetical protein